MKIYQYDFYLPSGVSDCSCTNYVTKTGYGNCIKDFMGKGPICYVNEPSNCTDRKISTENGIMQYSWEACKLACEL